MTRKLLSPIHDCKRNVDPSLPLVMKYDHKTMRGIPLLITRSNIDPENIIVLQQNIYLTQ